MAFLFCVLFPFGAQGFVRSNAAGNPWRSPDADSYIIMGYPINNTEKADTNRHEAVDLGLSVKWAACNIGAERPEDYGDYFAWGETETKEEYVIPNNLMSNVGIEELRLRGIIDETGKLTPKYDAACQLWGGSWRLPTKEEVEELVDRCTWTWVTENNVEGCRVVGPNGNHIFLPAAGLSAGTDMLMSDKLYGSYWAAQIGIKDGFAYNLRFGANGGYCYSRYGYGGQSIRPVTEK